MSTVKRLSWYEDHFLICHWNINHPVLHSQACFQDVVRELTGVIPVSFSLPLSSIRGRFGQVHKCVENSSGLTLAAKVIKARSLKEKVREPNPANIIAYYCATLVSLRHLDWSRGNTSVGETCLTHKRRCFVSRQRTAETFHCVCLCVRLPVSGRRWWRMRSRSWITWTTPTWSSSTQHTSPGMTSSLSSNSMSAFVNGWLTQQLMVTPDDMWRDLWQM